MMAFQSAFAQRFEEFIAYKRANGYRYRAAESKIKPLDRIAAERFPEKTSLDEELALAWVAPVPGEKPSTRCIRISLAREFAKFLLTGGEEAYLVPLSEHPRVQRRGRMYHIFTEGELRGFFAAADSLPVCRHSPVYHLTVPIYFRMLYCTGMRPGEPERLLVGDVDLETGEVFIRMSKRSKDRVVALPPDLLAMCRRYREHAAAAFPECPWFLPSGRGNQSGPGWHLDAFHRCWEAASGGGVPDVRPYDFRHSYATLRIARWMAEGRDVDALMPRLVAFMGHDNPEDTYYYFHLAVHLFPSLSRYRTGLADSPVPEAVDYVEC